LTWGTSSGESLEISEVIKGYLSKLRGCDAATPIHIANVFSRLDEVRKKRLKKYASLCKTLITGSAYRQEGPIFKKIKRPW